MSRYKQLRRQPTSRNHNRRSRSDSRSPIRSRSQSEEDYDTRRLEDRSGLRESRSSRARDPRDTRYLQTQAAEHPYPQGNRDRDFPDFQDSQERKIPTRQQRSRCIFSVQTIEDIQNKNKVSYDLTQNRNSRLSILRKTSGKE